MKSNNWRNKLYIGISFVIYIGIAIAQYTITDKQSFLIIALQLVLFGLSIFIGFKLDEIHSNDEVRKNLKEKAYSAIRRINDIQNFTERGLKILSNKSVNDINDLKTTINVTLSDIKVTLLSARYDWADVIGEDLRIYKELENKIKDYQSLSKESTNTEIDGQISRIRSEIRALSAQLPLELNSSTDFNDRPDFSKGQNLLNKEIEANNGIELTITVFDPILNMKIKENEPLYFLWKGDTDGNLVIIDDPISKKIIGMVENGYEDLGFDYRTYNLLVYEAFLIESRISININKIDGISLKRNRIQSDKEKHIFIPKPYVCIGVG